MKHTKGNCTVEKIKAGEYKVLIGSPYNFEYYIDKDLMGWNLYYMKNVNDPKTWKYIWSYKTLKKAINVATERAIKKATS
jgi:hypothetical protein